VYTVLAACVIVWASHMSRGARIAVLSVAFCSVSALAASDWTAARSTHAEVYSQAGEDNARATAVLVERLHAFFSRMAMTPDDHPPVRVIVFRSPAEYEPYRLRPSADAFYMGSGKRDYIVMPSPGPRDPHVLAHEYWHLIARQSPLHLPLWLGEGLAEFFSNVRLDARDREGSAEIAARLRSLRANTWMPLAGLLTLDQDSPLRDDPQAMSVFYAESGALAEMLLADPAYSARFPELVTGLASAAPAEGALVSVYSKSLEAITADLRTWIEKRRPSPVILPELAPEAANVAIDELSPLASDAVLASLLTLAGKLDRAEALYRDLLRRTPDDPRFTAALGMIALQKGDDSAAQQLLRRSVDHGWKDDEALFHLGLLDNNTGDHEAALADLRAIHDVPPARQFAYWAAIAYAANQLGRRVEAEAAAENARAHAATEDERVQAEELRVVAQTDVVPQFTRDANGQLRLVNTRKPHGSPDWNPFIEPGDHVRRAEGKLRTIECGAQTVFSVESAAGLLRLAIPDPQHVQMRNAPAEFTCGPQPSNKVSVVYAASGPNGGVLRGMEFR